MHNNEYHMWLAHAGHCVNIIDFEWTDHKEVMIGCVTCGNLVQVYEFIPEYEPLDNTAKAVIES